MTSTSVEFDGLLSRTSSEKQVELRGPCPASVVAVLDAVSMAKGITRTDLVNTVLRDFAKQEAHKASLVSNVLRGNPGATEELGMVS